MTELNGIRAYVFRPLPDVLRADAIAQRLTTAIALGLIRQGEQLPVENQLTVMFGAASATVRDALQALRDTGIIATRRGRSGGTFVVGTPTFDTQTLHGRLKDLSMAELRDLGDELAAVAVATIRLAHERALPNDFARLMMLAQSISTAEDPAACSRADSRFHIELAVLAQSERLMRTEIRLQSETVELLWSAQAADHDRNHALSEHVAIAKALRSDDVERAESLALQHAHRNIYRMIEEKMALTYPSDDSILG
jgi:DNA-binding FadR family transcriptional regulator